METVKAHILKHVSYSVKMLDQNIDKFARTTKRAEEITSSQGRPVNVMHDARCVTGKVGGRQKPIKGRGILIYCYKFAVIC